MTRRNHDRTFGLIDRATGDDAPYVDVPFMLTTDFPEHGRQNWPMAMRVPRAIADALNSADWEAVTVKYCRRPEPGTASPFEQMVIETRLRGGSSQQVAVKANLQIARVLYDIFSRLQLAAGNKAWLAPRSMVKLGKGGPN
jgi:hypothetical protein